EPGAHDGLHVERGLLGLAQPILRRERRLVAEISHKAQLRREENGSHDVQPGRDQEQIPRDGDSHKHRRRSDPGTFVPEQPLKWFTTQEYEFMYKNALVAKQQLEEAGIVVDLQVVDWATLNHRTEKPEGWDMSSTGFVFAADPALHVSLRCTFNGWWCNEE